MACAVETTRVSLEDCTCPICMCILIEPVTMPCHHELCRPCFKQNVEEASLLCPMCRTRIGTWARHATKTKTLVNQERWEQIQELFPKRVRLRLEGKDEEDDTCDVTFHPPVHLAAPGEIRKEYEAELKKLRQQLQLERRKEEIESEALIRRLQEEEDRERAKQNHQLEEINQNDEVLARELEKVINEAGADEPMEVLLEESKARLTRSNSVASNKSTNSTNGPLDTFFNKYKAKTDTHQTSPYPYPCISPSDKAKGGDNSRSNSSAGKKSATILNTDLDHTYCPRPNATKSSTVVRPPSDEIMMISDSSSDAAKERSESVKNSSESAKERSESVKNSSESAKERSESAASNDSISNELCHFKPILSCPRTPPRKMADGKIVDPPFVRTTPRNLSRNGFGSPVDSVSSPGLEPGSPIMQRRLSELALERQLLVQERSKSTSTRTVNTLHEKAPNPHHRENSFGDRMCRPPIHNTDSKATSHPGLGSSSGLLIPLEPLLEEHDHGDFDDITPVLLNLQKTSLNVNGPSTSKCPLQANSPSVGRNNRYRHNSKDAKPQTPNQRSIRDWFKNESRSGSNSADLFEDQVELIPMDFGKSKTVSNAETRKVESAIVKNDFDPSDDVKHKKKRKAEHQVTEVGDASVEERHRKKPNSKAGSTISVLKKNEKKFENDSEDDFSYESDVSGKGKSAMSKTKGMKVKRQTKSKSAKDADKHEDRNVLGRHRKQTAYSSDSELSFSEGENTSPVRKSDDSSPVRKSPRKRRRRRERDEDFEFNVDLLDMSDSGQSEVSIPETRRQRGRRFNKKLSVVKDLSQDEVKTKSKREKESTNISKIDEDVSKGDVVSKPGIKGSKLIHREICTQDSSDDEVEPLKRKPGKKGSRSVEAVGEVSNDVEKTGKQSKNKVSMRAQSDLSEDECISKETLTRKVGTAVESETDTEVSVKPSHKGKTLKKIDAENEKKVVPRCKDRKRKKRVMDTRYNPHEEEMASDSDDNENVRKKNCKQHFNKAELDNQKPLKRNRKRKAVTDGKMENTESEVSCVEKSPRRGRSKAAEIGMVDIEHDNDYDRPSEDVKQKSKKSSPNKESSSKSTKSPKSSPKKASPKKSSAKKDLSSDSETQSPYKRRRTRLNEDTDSLTKGIHLRRCATAELLEENVDPNANSNNSSSVQAQNKGKRRTRKEVSDSSLSVENAESPRKKLHLDRIDSDADDVFQGTSKSSPRRLQQRKDPKRSESVSVKTIKSKTLVTKKGRQRHASNDQQSIMRYLSGASDVDMRQDIDEELESDTTEGFSQEEEDRKMALKLQKQFNLEQKFRMNAERFKGGAEQYQFRRKPKYLD